jgi:energy-coupling factor transport system ATP-binding protein
MAGVLALQPRVLVLDEPTAGLDPVGRKRMLQQIKGLQREGICTVVLVTHNMEDAARWADRMLVLDQGKVLRQGIPRDIFSRPEELNQVGLEVPFPATLTRLLRESGYPVEQLALTIDEAEQTVKDVRVVMANRREMR